MNENWAILAIGLAIAFIVVGFLALPIYFIVQKCGRMKERKRANERANKIKLLPQCSRTLSYRLKSFSSVVLASAGECAIALPSGRRNLGSWGQEFAAWLASRNNADTKVIRVPELWDTVFVEIIPALITKGTVKWECLECGAIYEHLSKTNENCHVCLIDVYQCPRGHVLFQEVVTYMTPARLTAKENSIIEKQTHAGQESKVEKPVQATPPKFEKTYSPLEVLAKELSQTQVTKEKLASMILERQQLEQAVKNGEILNDDERKKLFLLKILLGGDGLQPAFETRTVSLEEADKFHAVGRFSFGQVRTLLMAQGYSRGDVIQFFERIQGGELSDEEASQFLSDCEEWQQIMAKTQESRDTFFARKRAERQRAKRSDPARN